MKHLVVLKWIISAAKITRSINVNHIHDFLISISLSWNFSCEDNYIVTSFWRLIHWPSLSNVYTLSNNFAVFPNSEERLNFLVFRWIVFVHIYSLSITYSKCRKFRIIGYKISLIRIYKYRITLWENFVHIYLHV